MFRMQNFRLLCRCVCSIFYTERHIFKLTFIHLFLPLSQHFTHRLLRLFAMRLLFSLSFARSLFSRLYKLWSLFRFCLNISWKWSVTRFFPLSLFFSLSFVCSFYSVCFFCSHSLHLLLCVWLLILVVLVAFVFSFHFPAQRCMDFDICFHSFVDGYFPLTNNEISFEKMESHEFIACILFLAKKAQKKYAPFSELKPWDIAVL